MIVFKILTFIILILGIGFFTSSETAYLSLNNVKIRNMQEQGKKGANVAAKLKKNIDKLLTTVLIGTNLLNSLTSALATALAISIFGKNSVEIVPFVVAFFITTFGQIIPKTAAGLYPEVFARIFAVPLHFLSTVFFPVVWIFERLSHGIVYLVEKLVKPSGTVITEDELKTLIDLGEKEGTIEKNESIMLHQLIKYDDMKVSQIMKKIEVVSMVDYDSTQEQVIQEFLSSGFSTIAVYKNNRQNIAGILNYKDIMFSVEEVDTGHGFAGTMMTDALYIPENMSALELLKRFRKMETQFAVVLNKKGQAAGIVTMKGIMKFVFPN